MLPVNVRSLAAKSKKLPTINYDSIKIKQYHVTDKLNLIEVANDFVANKQEHRSKVFGLFQQKDSCSKVYKCT